MLDIRLPFRMNLQHTLQDNAQYVKAGSPPLYKITPPSPCKSPQQNSCSMQLFHPSFSVVEKLFMTATRNCNAFLHGKIFIGSKDGLAWA